MSLKRLVVLTIVIVMAVWLLSHAASFLVLNGPQPADVILVLAGGTDSRTTATHVDGTGLKAVLCSDSGCPSAAAWPSM